MTKVRRNGNDRLDLPIDWSEVWQQHEKWLRTVLLARLRDGNVVDDVFQEIALVVSRKPNAWPNPNKVGPWLYRVAIRQVQLYRRRNARRTGDEKSVRRSPWEEAIDPGSIDPMTWLINRESEQQIRSALEQLGDQDREILMLKHAERWTYKMIASQLDISLDKVIYRLGRAREALKARLQAQCRDWIEQ